MMLKNSNVGDLGDLVNINDKWSRKEAITLLLMNPSDENSLKIQSAINFLTEGDFKPYKNVVDDMNEDIASQALVYYGNNGILKSDPYAALAIIEIAGSGVSFADRMFRMNGDNLSSAILDLLIAYLKIASTDK